MKHISAVLLTIFLTLLFTACGRGNKEKQNGMPPASNSIPAVTSHTGVIEVGDPTDPNHGNLSYDPYTFDAEFGDKVMVSVKTENFDPLLKLVEISTGAVLAEWDPKYSEGEGLTYTIAGPGKYETRVYAMKNGTGTYSLTIKLE